METMSSNRPREINVGCAGNAAFALPIAVMLTSVVCNAKTNRDIHIYIIESDMTDSLRQKIEQSVLQNKKSFHQVTFHWTKLDQFPTYDLPESKKHHLITPDAYSRLLLPNVLPEEAEQLIYLDADVVVIADLALLSDSADKNCTMCAAPSVILPYVSSTGHEGIPLVFNYVELGIPASNRYFNSGVLVINLKPWRKNQISSRVIDYVQRHRKQVLLYDQGALNAILFDQWSPLDNRWNQTYTIMLPEWWSTELYSREDWRRIKNDPFIVHYTGPDKPWLPGYKRPRLSFFTPYLKKTLFKNDVKIFSIESIIGYRLYFSLWSTKRNIHRLLLQWAARFRGKKTA